MLILTSLIYLWMRQSTSEKLFSENETVHNLTKDHFECLLILVTKESYFLFDGELYQQVDGVAMGSRLVLTLANIFLCHYEDI